MSVEIRTIEPAEFRDFAHAMRRVFLVAAPTDDEVEFMRQRFDLSRTWAAFDKRQIVATFHSFPTQLTVPGGTVAADAVTVVTVAPTHRRQGVLTSLMAIDHEAAAARGDAASILISAEWPIYGRFGYGPAADDADYTIDTRAARISGPYSGTVELCQLADLREDAARIYEQFRPTRPGSIEREPLWWDIKLGITPRPGSTDPVQSALRHRTGRTVDGVVRYHVENNWDNRVPNSTFIVDELLAATAEVERDLWRFCCELDLVRTIRAVNRSVDEPLSWLLHDGRGVLQTRRGDFLWVRPLNVVALLGARSYASAGRLVIEVIDPAGYAAGRFAIDSDGSDASCRRVKSRPDLTIGVSALGSICLGGVRLGTLRAAGLIDEHRPRAVDRGEAMFHSPVVPWCNTGF